MRLLYSIAITFLVFTAYAQRIPCYWVELKSKDSIEFKISQPHQLLSAKAIQRRKKYDIPLNETDVPVSQRWIDSLKTMGYTTFHSSRWFNALIVEGYSKRSLDSLSSFSFVKSVKYLGYRYRSPRQSTDDIPDINTQLQQLENKVTGKRITIDSNEYGQTFEQIHQLRIDSLHERGFNGKGVTVAILDAGFKSVNALYYMRKLFSRSLLVAARDFVHPNTDVFNDDDHGLSVFSIMAGHQPGTYIGSAPASSYVLLRSEDAAHENLLEEALWVIAAEYADSFGVDLIQSSLGYNEFDDDMLSHRFKELDGKTTLISRGASMAIQKGIVVVNSAGNEGDKDWRYIAAPADVEQVITVGGVDSKQRLALFSSQGPTADKRIKPDVMAMAEGTTLISPTGTIYKGNGTSYAAPLVAGLAAGLLQAKPKATPHQLANALRLSGTYYNKPDKQFGYGVPDALLALRLLGSDSAQNQILDARLLPDKHVHVALEMATPQRVQYTLKTSSGVLVYSGQSRFKSKGQFRFPLTKIRNQSSDLLTLEVRFDNSLQTFNFYINP
ncbi:MAG: S8 family peptidase [Bacteroidota bacterium]